MAAFSCFTGLAILMAICGCCCKCMSGGAASRLCACLYGTCLLPVMIIFLAVGSALMYFIQGVSEEQIEEQCPKIIDYAMQEYFADQEDTGLTQEEMDNMHVYDLTLINTFMCTDVCPCKDVPTKNEWLDLSPEYLNEMWPK